MWDSKKGRVAVGCGVMVAVSVLVGLVIYYASKDPYCKCEDLNRDRPPFVCPDPVITVEEGSLVGSCKPDITGNGKQYAAFFGVPYAKPPVGELRFKEPRPADKWVGVRDAKVQDDTVQCVQNVSGTVSGREDCLYMNIYVPETSGKVLLSTKIFQCDSAVYDNSPNHGDV
ncbi:juvenile hormone esterase-like isoform X1 [Frankliniella occidentalis]|uniref:Juvenile hormone esterase-like isoform X1 n=1 Tax=Frankliniella occidentalis TaxID=133901 RepID=A0A9C6X5E8_FRAOC|nr:juvenile hormone esterase-like isoform X1 [Frankliniella occidentalis]